MKEELEEEKDMTPILLEDLGMEYPNETSKHTTRYGIFECQYCGKEFKARLASIKNGHTKSCGCYKVTEATKHGLSSHRFYPTWNNMRKRCYNPNCRSYPDYGGRGITVCEEWQDIKKFIKWAEETYIEGYTIDRIDNDKGYSPENCRWTDKTTQNVNQRKKRNNTSGYVGVIWCKRNKAWTTQITSKNKRIYLGSYKEIEDAVKARDEYIIKNNLPHKLSTDYKKEEQ